MKRLKSSDDVNSYGGEKGVFKDWGRKDDDGLNMHQSSSSHRSFHYNSESGKKGLSSSSSSRYERVEDDRKRLIRKRSDYDVDSYERRKSHDRYRDRDRDRDRNERGILSSSPRAGGYGSDRIHRSESFSGPRRDFPKGFRSERDRPRREGSVSSWRQFGSCKEVDESGKSVGEFVKGSKAVSEEVGNVRSPQLGKDVKSPAGKDMDQGSKSGYDVVRVSKAASEEISNVRSPQGVRDAKSPAWSKESVSGQSKSESIQAESGNNSEREEGELEPDPHPDTAERNDTADGLPSDVGKHVDGNCLEDRTRMMSKEEIKSERKCEKANVEEVKNLKEATSTVDKLSSSEDSSTQRIGENETAIPLSSDVEKKDAKQIQDDIAQKEEDRHVSESSNPGEITPKLENDTKCKVKVESNNMTTSTHLQVVESAERNDTSGAFNHLLVTKELTQNFKDKGKSVTVSVSSGGDESNGFLTSKEIDLHGPSKRGFDLFFMDPVKKTESNDQKGVNKPKDEKLSLEPLELSLRLPSVLLPIGVTQPAQGPDSPSMDMSIQSQASSFQTSSDGFTRSFSGSQHFTHNPSCSLTETSFDFEQSVKSRPLFQGVNWQAQSSDDQKNAEPSMHLSNGNGVVPNAQSLQLHSARVAEGSYKTPLVFERQLSSNNNNNKQPSGSISRHQNDIRSPTQSVGSHDTGSDYYKDRKRVTREVIGTSSKSIVPTDMVESLLAMVVSDPLHTVARILNEMPAPSLTSLKELARDVILNSSRRRQFSAFRKALEKRSDITLETLPKAHSVQVEILVALKTGIQDFLLTNSDTSASDLAEIFLNLRCRNLMCRSYLPVDECECKICVQKKGFCSACMCLICSKFDMASNTCSWVGCDVCLHWCHTGCGLRESYIRNGRSANGALGQTEMQFHCVACGHPSEMFGFVREVFQNFAKGWTVETLANELEYVRKIFSGSDDIRGKRLHEIAHQMLTRLSNKSDFHQVRSYIMSFFMDDDAFKSDNIQISHEKVVKQILGEQSNNNSISKSSQEASMWMKSAYADRPIQLQTQTNSSDLHRVAPSVPIEPVFDELDGIVRIKLAEAQMFQMRADDARREAEGLNRIAQAKSKKIDEEYASRVTKLLLSEAEENRRQKLEELQVLENAHQEYFNMKVRMESEIKDLLLKMEATKRNFSSGAM
ncbi:protein OBERON 4 [Rutidosis leptorrhynchoides]|uniref:protein OBERON 4 n=1 Tax=Rutidosis leptorrhynchoides TaxID=125765 RepID=UPI003A98CF14